MSWFLGCRPRADGSSGIGNRQLFRSPWLFQHRATSNKIAAAISNAKEPMIRVDNVRKHHGYQILFHERAAALQKVEKAGLAGPNGAGKTSLFRMITGEDQP